MKRKYKNIRIPYFYYDINSRNCGYIYKDVLYFKESEVFTKYVGSYLTYHYSVNGNLKEVHDYEDVLVDVINNYDTFKIDNKYKDEYSPRELSAIHESIKRLKNKDFYDCTKYQMKFKKRLFESKEEKIGRKLDEEMKKYEDIDFPKEVFSDTLKRNVFVYKGICFYSALHCLEELTVISLYFQFNVDGVEDSYNHNHQHDFQAVINDLIYDTDNFIIYDFQKQFYSTQEIEFLNKLHKKLLDDNFHTIPIENDKKYLEHYSYLDDNNKKIRLFFYRIYGDYLDNKKRNKILKRYK